MSRRVTIQMRLTEAERAYLQSGMDAAKLPAGAYLRASLLTQMAIDIGMLDEQKKRLATEREAPSG